MDWRDTLDGNADEEAERKGKPQRDWASERPYLLLDVREEQDFARGHLVTAQHYPHSRLNYVNFEVCEWSIPSRIQISQKLIFFRRS